MYIMLSRLSIIHPDTLINHAIRSMRYNMNIQSSQIIDKIERKIILLKVEGLNVISIKKSIYSYFGIEIVESSKLTLCI